MAAEEARPRLVVRRAGERYRTERPGGVSSYSFSFGTHYDPGNVFHGVLIACNDELLGPGAGFDDHEHRNVEIVTWVADGVLSHAHSGGDALSLGSGSVQLLSADSPVLHAERNAEDRRPVRFVQMWIVPDSPNSVPRYQHADCRQRMFGGRLTTLASGMPRDAGTPALRLGNRNAALHAASLAPGDVLTLPRAPFLHVFLARGAVRMDGVGVLSQGDEVRCTGAVTSRLTATTATEVLVWEMHAAIGT